MTPAALALLLDLSGTIVDLRPTDAPGALAEVVFENIATNDERETGDYLLTLDGLTVGLRFIWNGAMAGADAIEVTPPDGVICKPTSCRLELLEGTRGAVVLYPWEGM